MIQFHTEYLKIPKEDIPFSDREAQTIATASTLSSLVYSDNPIGDLQQRNLRHFITKLWPLAGRNGEMLIAWSAPLDTCFVVFRGTATLNDWTDTNLRTAKITMKPTTGEYTKDSMPGLREVVRVSLLA